MALAAPNGSTVTSELNRSEGPSGSWMSRLWKSPDYSEQLELLDLPGDSTTAGSKPTLQLARREAAVTKEPDYLPLELER